MAAAGLRDHAYNGSFGQQGDGASGPLLKGSVWRWLERPWPRSHVGCRATAAVRPAEIAFIHDFIVVSLFGQEELAVVGEIHLAGVAADQRGRTASTVLRPPWGGGSAPAAGLPPAGCRTFPRSGS